MIDERGDEDLKRRFDEVKAHDRRGARAFADVMASARGSGGRRGRPRAYPAAAAVLLLIAGGAAAALIIHSPHEPERVAIGSWRSPTDFLLQRPGGALLDSLPGVTASVIRFDASVQPLNHTSRKSGHTKGDTT